ncbi:MAG: AAA family ATPase [Lentisphaeria bacterium]|nr:AAA family ATPase [Lentisphaeria bacterium]
MTENNKTTVTSLTDYLEAEMPVIYINSFDFEAVDDIIADAVNEWQKKYPEEDRKYKLFEFSHIHGTVDFKHKNAGESPCDLISFLKCHDKVCKYSHKFLVLREIHDCIRNEKVYSAIQSIACRKSKFNARKRNESNLAYTTIFIVDTKLEIPSEIEHLITVIDLKDPEIDEIKAILQTIANDNDTDCSEYGLDALAECFKGYSRLEIKRIAKLAVSLEGAIEFNSCKKIIESEKKQAFKKSNLLEYIILKQDEIGGLEHLKKFLSTEKDFFKKSEEAYKWGKIKPPTGIVLLGMPGCGKSLCANLVAREFDCPLLRLDMGRVLGKYVGESEENFRRALKTVERSSPCILWIDELEKAFSGVNGEGSGGEIMTRLLGFFLTWLQEKTSPIYVFATANDISKLPPEFLRKGRFDEIFRVMLPDEKDLEDIFKTQIKSHFGDREKSLNLDYHKLAVACSGKKFSGADVACIVNEACKKAFLDTREKRVLQMNHLLDAIKVSVSSYFADKEKYEAMEKKLLSRSAVDASTGKTVKGIEK